MPNHHWTRKADQMIREAHPEVVILSETFDLGNWLGVMVEGKPSIRLGPNDDWLEKFKAYLERTNADSQ